MNKILLLDIETKPATAYVWGLFDKVIPIDRIIAPGGVICVSAKFLDEKKVYFFSEWGDGYEGMLGKMYELMVQADAVVTYNGNSFDIPKLRGAFLLAGLPPLPPLTSIDLYKTVKKLGYTSGKLGFVGPLLGLGKKVPHEGFSLWKKVLDGDPRAQKKMESYCRGDTILLEKLYKRIRPHVQDHPWTGKADGHSCPVCSSTHVQSRGYRRTRMFRIQRIQCQDCGAWAAGTREKWTT